MFLDWTLETVLAHTCRDSSHGHLTWAETRQNRDFHLIETLEINHELKILWLRSPDPVRGIKGVVRWVREIPIRGLSCRVGGVIATAVAGKQEWADVMLSHIRMQRETAPRTEL